ncbi:MAG: glycosyltransferase family 2 protein [Catalinimonas sp.]
MEFLFWTALAIVFYTYAGYGGLLWGLTRLKHRRRGRRRVPAARFKPEVTLVVPARNEADLLPRKLRNLLALDYPAEKLRLLFVTDGSTDGSEELLRRLGGDRIEVLHQPKCAGKAAAVNRAVRHVTTPFVVICDADTELDAGAVRALMNPYGDAKVGAVLGDKRVRNAEASSLHRRYESWLKRRDDELHTLVAAGGELFSFRTAAYTPLKHDTILGDFVQSLLVAGQGYRVAYAPDAYATELPPASARKELKQKIRLCAGGWQAMVRLAPLLRFWRNPLLSFQYVSHRALRWSLAPPALLLLLPMGLLAHQAHGGIYTLLWAAQLGFYALVGLGWLLGDRRPRWQAALVPFDFFLMNWAVCLGFVRWVRGRQAAASERAQRPYPSGELRREPT